MKINWQDAVVDCGQRFMNRMEGAFIEEVRRAELFLPKLMVAGEEKQSGREFLLNCFFDYLVGTSVAIAAGYASLEPDFEEQFVEVVREKFRRAREIKKEGDNNDASA